MYQISCIIQCHLTPCSFYGRTTFGLKLVLVGRRSDIEGSPSVSECVRQFLADN